MLSSVLIVPYCDRVSVLKLSAIHDAIGRVYQPYSDTFSHETQRLPSSPDLQQHHSTQSATASTNQPPSHRITGSISLMTYTSASPSDYILTTSNEITHSQKTGLDHYREITICCFTSTIRTLFNDTLCYWLLLTITVFING